MFPVRVAVETVRPAHCLSCAHDGQILMETYAIVSGATLLNQLVDTVLSALGQPHLAVNSRGLVQINNWKALPFESITDNQEDTVETLFKDISSHLTLRILTKPGSSDSQSTACISELKQRLLKAAVAKQPDLLASVDNKQIKDIIRSVIEGDDPSILNPEQINAINDWLDTLDNGKDERRSPTGQVRFNQLFEMPKLDKWFRSDPSPNRHKLLQYMNILNNSSYRQSHPKITYQQLCNWFSNQRSSTRSSRPAISSASSTLNGGCTTPISLSATSTTASSILPKTELPLSMIADYRPKFDFNSLFESCSKKSQSESDTRMEGGSDSPAPADDHSVHSTSDNGTADVEFGIKQESSASSPDMGLNLGSSVAASPRLDMNAQNNASRSRLMFDPLTELPVLEKWFEENQHPTWMQIDQYTQILNSREYRENYPHISQHNVKIWFKNRRAKCKRLQTGISEKLMQLGAAAAAVGASNSEIPAFLMA